MKPEPLINNFTPINQINSLKSATGNFLNVTEGADLGMEKATPRLASKRKWDQVPELAARSKEFPKTKNQDISRGLRVTKSIPYRKVRLSQDLQHRSSNKTPFVRDIVPDRKNDIMVLQKKNLKLTPPDSSAIQLSIRANYGTANPGRETGSLVVEMTDKDRSSKDQSRNVTNLIICQSLDLPPSGQAAIHELQGGQDCIVESSYDEVYDFPMDKEEIEEIMQLTGNGETSAHSVYMPVSQGQPDELSPINDEYGSELEWLEVSSSLDIPTTTKDGKTFQTVVMNGADIISLTCPVSRSAFSAVDELHSGHANSKCLEHADSLSDDDDIDFESLETKTTKHTVGVVSSSIVQPTPPALRNLQSVASPTHTPTTLLDLPQPPTDTPHLISFDTEGNPIPFIRPPFPPPLRDRSPITGLTTRMLLRTCFRIGDALNAAAAASRSNVDAIIELYARVVSSERVLESFKQHFQFTDLFTGGKPPFLAGTFGLWRGVGLWDVDSRVFLGDGGRGKMARVMGRIKRDASGKRWEMSILSVWQVDWEDVGVAKGIVLS